MRAYSVRNMQLSYGKGEAVLMREEATQSGWVSAYVMDPDDLLEFGQARLPTQTAVLRKLIAKELGVSELRPRIIEEALEHNGIPIENGWTELNVNPKISEGFALLRSQLHTLDFTESDFTDLLHQQLLLALQSKLGTPEFEIRLTQLTSGNALKLAEALDALFYKPLALPRDFELKVPVAVPPSALRAGN
jgi:hypothetical protein